MWHQHLSNFGDRFCYEILFIHVHLCLSLAFSHSLIHPLVCHRRQTNHVVLSTFYTKRARINVTFHTSRSFARRSSATSKSPSDVTATGNQQTASTHFHFLHPYISHSTVANTCTLTLTPLTVSLTTTPQITTLTHTNSHTHSQTDNQANKQRDRKTSPTTLNAETVYVGRFPVTGSSRSHLNILHETGRSARARSHLCARVWSAVSATRGFVCRGAP